MVSLVLTACLIGGNGDRPTSGVSSTIATSVAGPPTDTTTATTPATTPTSGVTLGTPPVVVALPTFARTVHLTGLQNPGDMAILPSGVFLFIERTTGLWMRLADGTRDPIFYPTDMVVDGASGMLGLAIDPQFATTRVVYLFIGSNASGRNDYRVIAATLDSTARSSVIGRRDIVTGIPYAAGTNPGGVLRFGPDNLLHIGTGDGAIGPAPQRLSALTGKVLRVDRDGNAAAGNNVPAGGDPRVYAYGIRNPQGLAFRPTTATAYLSEEGPGYSDEVTGLRAAGNGGWDPVCADALSYCGNDGRRAMTDTVKFPAALRPAWTSGATAGGIAGATFLSGAAWQGWDGALVVAELSGRRLNILQLDAAGTSATSSPLLAEQNVRLRAVMLGPDGSLYVTTDAKPGGDEIWRLTPRAIAGRP